MALSKQELRIALNEINSSLKEIFDIAPQDVKNKLSDCKPETLQVFC